MGSAAACHLSRRGKAILGLDRFRPPHDLGSSHGQTRIIREAYFEHPSYVPLIQRGYELWRELEEEWRSQLMIETGGLMIGAPESGIVQGAIRSARLHDLEHKVFPAEEVAKRFLAIRPPASMVAVWEPRAGMLFPDRCISAHLSCAAAHGARLHFEEPLVRWEKDGVGVRVKTPEAEYLADSLVLCPGSWIGSLVPEWEIPFTVERQVLFWFDPRRNPRNFRTEFCPVHIWEHQPGRYFYGFPAHGDGIKFAIHHEGQTCDPDTVNRFVMQEEVQTMRDLIRTFVPDANGELRSTTVCLYTNLPDGHFLINAHPDHPRVLVASPCSGHGFKFASVVGEVLADLATGCNPRYDLSLFRFRFR